MGSARRTIAGDRLHEVADRLVTSLSVDDEGGRPRGADEADAALDTARDELPRYHATDFAQHTPEADVLAEALQALLDWPKPPESERGDFTTVLYALEMARYQYGGPSQRFAPEV